MKSFLEGFSYQSRHTLQDAIPSELGSLSLGYSHADQSLRVYLTKRVGQKGIIDVNLSSFIAMWRNAISNKQFTPELANFFQNLSNELMPGFEFGIASWDWFLRPHAQDAKIGFALIGSYTVNMLSDILKLQDLSINWVDSHPGIRNFGVRRFTKSVPNIGDITVSLFAMISSSTDCMLMVSVKCLFNPLLCIDSKALPFEMLDKASMSINRMDASDATTDEDNTVIHTSDNCMYRKPFIVAWIAFVSAIFWKRYSIHSLQRTSKL